MSSSSSGNALQGDKRPGTSKPAGKLLRLRGRSRPLHEAAIAEIADEEGPDVWFVCREGKVVGGHKIILSVSSKFFATVLQDQNTTDQTVINVPDMPIEVLQIILSLLYRDNVNVPLDIMTDISGYMNVFGMGLDKFIVGEAKENADPLQTRVYDHIPNGNKTGKEKKQEASASNRIDTAPVVPPAVAKGSNAATRSSTASSSNNNNSKKDTIDLQPLVPVIAAAPVAPAQPLQLVNYAGKYYTLKPSQDPKMPAQMHLLDPQPIINTVSVPIPSAESAVLGNGNGLVVQQEAKRPRLILPKPLGGAQGITSGKGTKMFRPITASELMKRKAEEPAQRETAGGPPVLERMTNEPDEENAIEMDADEDHVADANDVHEKYEDWLANVGKSSTSPSPTPPKLMKVTPLKRQEMASMRTPEKDGSSHCHICGITFNTKNKIKWHTDRHIGPGVFKCPKCPKMFTSAKSVHMHELEFHPQPAKQQPDKLQHPNPAAQSSTCYKSSLHRAVGMSSASSAILARRNAENNFQKRLQKYRSASRKNLHQNFAGANPLIVEGKGPGEESIEPHKLKKLHWLYVCNKCENCTDTTAKAVAHHKLCYPDESEPFEKTILKYRQGFYGKVECPLCPRRYPTLGGFLIHCGQLHASYRRMFSHLTFDDLLLCQTCREKFEGPKEFHAHLNKNQRCDKGPYGDQGADGDLSPVASNAESSEDLRQRAAKYLGKNPRSARLQNKLAVVTGTVQEDETPEVKEDELEPVTCPACNEDNIKLLTNHLNEMHEDLEANVERIEAASLRCKDCGISFAICDLITHVQSCTQSKGMGYARSHRRYIAKPAPAKPKASVLHYPEGIGQSPVDRMENANLLDRDLIRQAVKCSVCDKDGRQMSKITACLKSHGIYRCAICFNTYLSKDDYTNHVKVVHGIPHSTRWACPICDVTRSNIGQLTSHMQRNHWNGFIKDIIVEVKIQKRAERSQDDDAYETAGESDAEFMDSFGQTGDETEDEEDVRAGQPQAKSVQSEESIGDGGSVKSVANEINSAPGATNANTNGPSSSQSEESIVSKGSETLQEKELMTANDAGSMKMEVDVTAAESSSGSSATKTVSPAEVPPAEASNLLDPSASSMA